MTSVVRRLRRRIPEEGGMTLLELTVAMALLGIVLLVFTTVLASIQKNVDAATDRSTNNDQARLAVEQLDREIRSGNILYDPLTDDPPSGTYPGGMYLRIYTQSNGVPFRCVEWRISSGELQRRQRDPGESGAWPSTWRDVADDVVNASQKVSAFKLDPDLSKGKRTLDVKILVNSTPSNSSTQVTITEALTGRNTSYGYPPAVCDPFVKN